MAQLTLTEAAASQIQHLMAEEKNPQLMLRVTILGGGCSGFQYTFLLDDKTQDDDQIFENHGVKVVSSINESMSSANCLLCPACINNAIGSR